jgi:hypothetical protein
LFEGDSRLLFSITAGAEDDMEEVGRIANNCLLADGLKNLL